MLFFNREVNKQLRDENDSLRAIIEANKSNPIAPSYVSQTLNEIEKKFILNFHRLFPHQNDLHLQRVQLWVRIGIIQN